MDLDNENTHSSSSLLIPSQSLIWLCVVPCWVSQLKHGQNTDKRLHCVDFRKTCCKMYPQLFCFIILDERMPKDDTEGFSNKIEENHKT